MICSLAGRTTKATQSTVGMDNATIPAQSGKGANSKRGRSLLASEVGGAMARMWPKYLGSSNCVCFVVDGSDPSSLPDAMGRLSECYEASSESTQILVALSKRDLPIGFSERELQSFLPFSCDQVFCVSAFEQTCASPFHQSFSPFANEFPSPSPAAVLTSSFML